MPSRCVLSILSVQRRLPPTRRARPPLDGAAVPFGFQLLIAGGHTVNEGGTTVKAGTSTLSSFSRTIRLRHRGVYRALVKVSDGAHISAYSAPILVR